MLKSIRWDVYTVIIVALIPVILGAAWGLTSWEDHRLHKEQCAMAMEWLESNEQIAPQFENAGTMDDIGLWIKELEEYDSPAKAGQLRWGILQSARYQNEYFPDEATAGPGVLNPPDGLFSRDITEGTQDLMEHCPDTQAMFTRAFPMVFTQEPEIED